MWANRNLGGVHIYEFYDETVRAEKENGISRCNCQCDNGPCRAGNQSIEMGPRVLCEKPFERER